MADFREPPPLFNDDDDSRKDDGDDDLFTSAVQSPVSGLTTPEDQGKQEGAGDPLTSPTPAAPLPHNPSGADRPDLFESCEEPTPGGFSSVPLDQSVEGDSTQQVSTEAQDSAPANPPSSTTPSTTDDIFDHPTPTPTTTDDIFDHPTPSLPSSDDIFDQPALTPPSSDDILDNPTPTPPSLDAILDQPTATPMLSDQPTPTLPSSDPAQDQPAVTEATSTDIITDEMLADITPTPPDTPEVMSPSPFTDVPQSSSTPASDEPLSSTTASATASTGDTSGEVLASPPSSSALLDQGMTHPQELCEDRTPHLVDAPTVEPAHLSSLDVPVEGSSDATNVSACPTNPTGDAPPAQELESDLLDAETVEAVPEVGTDSHSHDPPAFLGDGDTTEISLDDNAQEVSLEDEADDPGMFDPTTTPKLQLSQEPPLPASNILPPMGAPLTPPVAPITPTVTPNLTPNVTPAAPTPVTPIAAPRSNAEEVDGEKEDQFLEISISDPQKIGDGMSSYMAYKVTTKTNITFFRKKHWSVTRRFSDFLGLHGKLVEKHLHAGRIIPPAPEKSAIGTTKIKLGSDKSGDTTNIDFIERRRASLERYMNRTGAHPTLRADPDYREFIELDAELPRATQTSALSSAGVLRLFNRVGETVNKMTFKMDESDQWFEEKTQQIESLDAQLRKLHLAMEGLVAYRRDLAISTASFSKSTAVLSSVEEHSALSRALHQLAESTERTHTIHHAQADADFYHLSETTKDYINLIGAVKDVFHERVKTFQTWQHAQTMLAKKRELKAKAELAGRMDKVQQAQDEVAEWEVKVERSQEEFERMSRAIKKEMDQFDVVRVKDFKEMLVKYLEALMTSQQQIIKVWETFLPEARAIT